jgi:leader peptidase (prepilin peptidase)/N-methyltransferase
MTGVPLIVVASLVGLLIGSFLNVCVFRWPRDLSVVHPRSFCPGCEKPIAWYDNIPLLSYALLGGRCRHCREFIPWRYPTVELSTAIAFGLCAAAFGWKAETIKYSLLSAILIALTASDMESRILPDEFTLGGTLVGFACSWWVPMPPLFVTLMIPAPYAPWRSPAESAFGAIVASGSIWLVALLYEKFRHKEGMGLGDVKMIAMIGSFLGVYFALLTLLLASFVGSVAGLIYIKATKKDAATYELPFGSFLGATALAVMFVAQVWPALRGR